MANHAERKSKTGLYVIIVLVIIILLCGGIYFALNYDSISTNGGIFSESIKSKTVTAENYDELMEEIEQKMQDDEELYYLSYSVMYYIMKDGFTEEYMTTQDDSLLYKNIYNKTVQKLIDEGKQLMEDNNVTIEEYKQSLEDLNNAVTE